MSGELLGNIGIIFWCIMIFLIFFGYSRNNTVLVFYFIGALILTILGLGIFNERISWSGNSNVAGILFAPLMYLTFYVLLRNLYKRAYKFEPDFVPHWNYSHRDGRKLNIFDFIVYLLPTLFSFFISLFISRNF